MAAPDRDGQRVDAGVGQECLRLCEVSSYARCVRAERGVCLPTDVAELGLDPQPDPVSPFGRLPGPLAVLGVREAPGVEHHGREASIDRTVQ